MIPKSRFRADENLVQGSVNIVTRGTLFLQWDNTYSWFNSKQLLYSITLDEPDANGATADSTAAGQNATASSSSSSSNNNNNNDNNATNSTPAPAQGAEGDAKDGKSRSGSVSSVTVNPAPGKGGFGKPHRVIFVLGGTGAGKEPQCKRLAAELKMHHISAEQVLLDAPENSSASKVLLQTLQSEDKQQVALIDGFPRQRADINEWMTMARDRVELLGVVLFDCPEQVMVSRLCATNDQDAQVPQENTALMAEIVAASIQQILPVVQYFENQGKLWRLDAAKPDQVVANQTRRLLTQLAGPEQYQIPTTVSTGAGARGAAADGAPVVPEGNKVPVEAQGDLPPPPPPKTAGVYALSTGGKKPLRVILGTMTFGVSVSEPDSLEMLMRFVDSPAAKAHTTANGKHEIDTARM